MNLRVFLSHDSSSPISAQFLTLQSVERNPREKDEEDLELKPGLLDVADVNDGNVDNKETNIIQGTRMEALRGNDGDVDIHETQIDGGSRLSTQPIIY